MLPDMWFSFAIGSVVAWSIPLVLDSIIVKHYEKNPFVLMWVQSCFSMTFLSIAAFFVPLESVWVPWLILTSLVAYCGDVILFTAMDRMDISVLNIAWAFMAIFLSVVGFLFFGESWTIAQTVAVVCILGGVSFLSYWHHHVNTSAVVMLIALAALYAPSNAVQKAALFSGELIYTTVFWQLLARETCAFVFPWTMPSFRTKVKAVAARVDALFYFLAFWVIITYFLGMYLLAEAYRFGPISLVSVVGNIQPFVVLFFAWLAWKLFPRYCPKELLDGQSVVVKLLCFTVVFIGLNLLAIS